LGAVGDNCSAAACDGSAVGGGGERLGAAGDDRSAPVGDGLGAAGDDHTVAVVD
jgi:hypothetical protein